VKHGYQNPIPMKTKKLKIIKYQCCC